MKKKSVYISNALFIAAVAIILLMFLDRMSKTVGMIDEVFNISIANQLVQGARPFVECWDLYQTGAIFLAPFLYVFKLLTGSTDGIILFSRYVYLFFNLVIVFLAYLAFRKKIGTKAAILSGLFMLTFAPLSMYYPWYDSVAVTFMNIGLLLLISGIQMKSNNRRRAAFVCAGFIHACMCISYPQFVIVASALFICTVLYAIFVDKKIQIPLFYALGAAIVIAIVLIYVMAVGKDNILMFNAERYRVATSRKIKITMSYYKLTSTQAIKQTMLLLADVFKLQLIPLAIYIINRFAKKYILNIANYIAIFVCACVAIPGKLSVFSPTCSTPLGNYAMLAFFFIIACWSLLLVWDLPKEHRGFGFTLILFYIPAVVLGFNMVSITASGADPKAMIATYAAAMPTVVFISLALKSRNLFRHENVSAKDVDGDAPEAQISNSKICKIKSFCIAHEKYIKTLVICIVLIIASLCSINVFNRNIYFDSKKISEHNVVKSDGIYKGIKLTQTEIDKTKKYEEALKSSMQDGDETIMIANENLIHGYMISDLKPATRGLWSIYVNNSFAGTKKYFEDVSGEPDIIVRSASDKDFNEEVTKFVSEKYTQVYADGYCVIFHKK